MLPVYDIGRVQLLAKGPRAYRVCTCDLKPGVDMLLAVRVGGIAYVHDDRRAGALGSEMACQVGVSGDVEAIVEIREFPTLNDPESVI